MFRTLDVQAETFAFRHPYDSEVASFGSNLIPKGTHAHFIPDRKRVTVCRDPAGQKRFTN
ncbi:MAG: hypothetical protein JWM11_2186, partial [Planctomycetaceae bacterium]|nr:hypothetical protein [Planctomycetaceae bacterium]